jgi:hypothetical protein
MPQILSGLNCRVNNTRIKCQLARPGWHGAEPRPLFRAPRGRRTLAVVSRFPPSLRRMPGCSLAVRFDTRAPLNELEHPMTRLLQRVLAPLATVLVAAHAHAFEAGWMQIQTAGATPDAPTTTVALYYPTTAVPRPIAMGPFSIDAAIGGKPVDKVKALILLSHGKPAPSLGTASWRKPLPATAIWSLHSVILATTIRIGLCSRRAPSAISTSGRGKLLASSTRSWPTPRGRLALQPTARGLSWVRWDTRPAATQCWLWRAPGQICPG